jgi:hypothetical protein
MVRPVCGDQGALAFRVDRPECVLPYQQDDSASYSGTAGRRTSTPCCCPMPAAVARPRARCGGAGVPASAGHGAAGGALQGDQQSEPVRRLVGQRAEERRHTDVALHERDWHG